MQIIEQSHEVLNISNVNIVPFLANCARTCYKSEDKSTAESNESLVRSLVKKGHHSQIEHVSMTIKFITDRAVLAELTRHRLASFSVESQRYVRYKNMQFIKPVDFDSWPDLAKHYFEINCQESERDYHNLLKEGLKPQQARIVLPNSVKTEIIITANLREWRHIFKLRTSKAAHPQIRALIQNLLNDINLPIVFD